VLVFSFSLFFLKNDFLFFSRENRRRPLASLRYIGHVVLFFFLHFALVGSTPPTPPPPPFHEIRRWNEWSPMGVKSDSFFFFSLFHCLPSLHSGRPSRTFRFCVVKRRAEGLSGPSYLSFSRASPMSGSRSPLLVFSFDSPSP